MKPTIKERLAIRRALIEDADVVGEVHSVAWKQTYQGVFDQEYLDSDSPSVRREEFLSSLDDKHCVYLLLEEEGQAAGIVKLLANGNEVEIASIYILEEFRGRGFGRKALEYIFSEYKGFRIVLWVLEVNLNARAFYEKCGFELTDKVRQIDRGGEFKQLMYARSGSGGATDLPDDIEHEPPQGMGFDISNADIFEKGYYAVKYDSFDGAYFFWSSKNNSGSDIEWSVYLSDKELSEEEIKELAKTKPLAVNEGSDSIREGQWIYVLCNINKETASAPVDATFHLSSFRDYA